MLENPKIQLTVKITTHMAQTVMEHFTEFYFPSI